MLRTSSTSFSSAQKTSDRKPVRVAIRGITGLLGTRLALALQRDPRFNVSAAVARNDPSLRRFLDSMKALGEQAANPVFERMFLDERHKVVRDFNSSNSVDFYPVDQLNLSKECDVLVDTTSPGNFKFWEERYQHFRKPVLLQSGEYPNGRLISPPFLEPGTGNLFRQGDCILSGLIPVLFHLLPFASRLTLNFLTQYTEKLMDYTTDVKLKATYVRSDVAKQLNLELSSVFDGIINSINLERGSRLGCDFSVMGVLQVPGLSHYVATIVLETHNPMSGNDIAQLLKGKPRIRTVPSLKGTDELQYHKELVSPLELPPLTVFGEDLDSSEKRTYFRFFISMDYKYLVPYANLDSLGMIALDLDPLDAMRRTDEAMNFVHI